MIEIFVFGILCHFGGFYLLDTALHCAALHMGLQYTSQRACVCQAVRFLSRPLWNRYEIACTFIPLHFMR